MKTVKNKAEPRPMPPQANVLDGGSYGCSSSSCDDSNPLNFPHEHQQHSEWCWAAVACMVADYYDGIGGSSSSGNCQQCSIVCEALGRNDCCENTAFWVSNECNHWGYLHESLYIVGHLNTCYAGMLSYSGIQDQINRCRPIGVRIWWDPRTEESGGHFIAIFGFEVSYEGGSGIYIADPWPEAGGYTYSQLLDESSEYPIEEYAGGWSHTYLTQP